MKKTVKSATKIAAPIIEASKITPKSMSEIGLFLHKKMSSEFSSANLADVGLPKKYEVKRNGQVKGIVPLEVTKGETEIDRKYALSLFVQMTKIQSRLACAAVASRLFDRADVLDVYNSSGLTNDQIAALDQLYAGVINYLQVFNTVDLLTYSESAKGEKKSEKRDKIVVTPKAELSW